MLVDGVSRRYMSLCFVAIFIVFMSWHSYTMTDNIGTGVGQSYQPHVPSGEETTFQAPAILEQDAIEPSATRVQHVQTPEATAQPPSVQQPDHLVLFSASTKDKKYFNLKLGTQNATNANIIPSAVHNDSWTVVAVMQRSTIPNSIWFAELVCEAQFVDGVLSCLKEPMILPIPSTNSDLCIGDKGYWALNVGPHDARVFYGPEHPYIIYGSNSKYNCFGLFMQDFRMLVDWGLPVWPDEYFRLPTDLQRPGEHGIVEKNWFAFWDTNNTMYIHYDIIPKRVFATISMDGTAGPDLGTAVEEHDAKCLKKYLSHVPHGERDNAIHQGTNSLSITLCKRADPKCKVTDSNTFIATIAQHKTLWGGHAEYEPYLFLFQQSAPFKLHGISTRPLWIHGREEIPSENSPHQHTQMFYVTSMSWKATDQKYHGYIDDVMFLGFGIEDDRPAAIDVVAGDIIEGLGLCDS